jgi:hypothetical protein
MHSYPGRQPVLVYYDILSRTPLLCDGRWKLVLSQSLSARFRLNTRRPETSR